MPAPEPKVKVKEPEAAVLVPPAVQAPGVAPSLVRYRYQNSTDWKPEPLVLSEAEYVSEMLDAELVDGGAVIELVGATLSRTVVASAVLGAASVLPATSVARV